MSNTGVATWGVHTCVARGMPGHQCLDMKWKRGASSEHVRDERGESPSGAGGLGGLGSIIGGLGPLGKGGGAVGIIVALLAVILVGKSILSGGGAFDPGGLDTGNQAPAAGAGLNGAPDPDAELVDFVTYVFDDVQSTWQQQLGDNYQPADLVLFTGQTQSGCGLADSGMGPFYCPVDMTARLDLDFFRELSTRFGAPGDFAQAYVIAHEMGHHVQNLVGISDKVHEQEQSNPDQANELSVRLELQADCLAGVWAHGVFARGDLEQGDVEEAIGAATAVGDDTLQRQATGTINQDTWTHGSSTQRVKWFNVGFDSGDAGTCDTFGSTDL